MSILENNQYAIKFTAKENAQLMLVEIDNSPLGSDEILAETLISLISSGTEVVGGYSATHYQITSSSYPMSTGYASISKVVEIGKDVKEFRAFGKFCGWRLRLIALEEVGIRPLRTH